MKISKVNSFKKVFGFGSVLASADELKLKPINIAFSKEHAHLEKEFLREYAVKSQGAFRFAMILALIFYDLFAILDKSTVPDIYQQIWIIRFGIVTPVLIIAFFFSFNKLFLKFGQITIALVWFITGGGIIYMNIIMSGVGIYSYYAGLMLIFFFGYTFVRARFLNSVLIGWVLFLGYMLTSYFYTDLSANHLKITGAFFLSANLIGMFINYTLEVNARRDFFMRKLVAIEQEKVVAANESLVKDPDNYILKMDVIRALLHMNKYTEAILQMENISVLPFEGASSGRMLYEVAHTGNALDLMKSEKYNMAVEALKKAKVWDESMGVGEPFDGDNRLQDYLLSHCYAKINMPQESKNALGRVIQYSVDHPKSTDDRRIIGIKALMDGGHTAELEKLKRQDEDWNSIVEELNKKSTNLLTSTIIETLKLY